MRFFLIDSILSSIFNIALVVFWMELDFSSQTSAGRIRVNVSSSRAPSYDYDYLDERKRLIQTDFTTLDDAINLQNNTTLTFSLASELKVILIAASLILLLTNLFTFRRIKKKFKEFKTNGNQPRMGIFLGSSDGSHSRWNLSQTQANRKLELETLSGGANVSQRTTNDYAEVHPMPDEAIYEPIIIYRTANTNSDTYESIYKPESEQYEEINYM